MLGNISVDIVEYIRLCLVWLCVTFTVLSLTSRYQHYRKLPPGPWGLPVLGNLHRILKGVPHNWYKEICHKYGDIVSFKLGSKLVVCVGSTKLLRDLFNRPDSVGRPKTPLNNLLQGRGIMLSDGQLWKRHRQFLHEKLRALGVTYNVTNFQQVILLEIQEVFTILSRKSQSVDPAIVFGRHIHNIITRLMMSFRFEENDPDFVTFNESISRGMKLYGSINIGEYLSWYLWLPGKMAVMREIESNLEEVSRFHLGHVQRRKELRRTTASTEPTDLLDFLLEELEKEELGESRIFSGVEEPEKQIVQVMNDLFSGGMETARTVIVWLLLVMLHEPTAAKKVRSELNNVVNPGDLVTLEHRPQLVFLEAVIYETLRRVSPVPLGTVHVNNANWTVNGYQIPEGTQIVPLISKIHMDPKLFPNPEEFKPERFLQNGSIIMPENFIPFGVGRRLCLGDQLAKMEMFLFFANIMNTFMFALPPDQPLPSLEGTVATIHAPDDFKLTFDKINA